MAAPVAQAATRVCAEPTDWRPTGTLPQTMAAMTKGQVTVLAIGSSSTEGVGASSPARSYPARLEAEWEASTPTVDVKVVNAGIGGEVAEQTLKRLLVALDQVKPDLVIWQLGSNDALRGIPIEQFALIANNGIEAVKKSGADLLLMDLQYAPALDNSPVSELYEREILRLAADTKTGIIQRWRLTRHWKDVGFMNVAGPDGLHMTDEGYGCLALLLSKSIVSLQALALQR
ncbi:SGNH/GDSL hydrolase family protein [Lacibacterium aquatile]|uniref:SGNH/GDSL hydrolase family protein n=1 Tax=Lacibacterium aquatile TaxID=1168082 RepID=A0ABW5DR29_9PROT